MDYLAKLPPTSGRDMRSKFKHGFAECQALGYSAKVETV
jgi:hypothetical protein